MNLAERRGTWLLLFLFVGWSLTAVAAAQSKDAKQDKKSDSKDSKANVEEIGNRDVGKGLNIFSLEREIALGKALAQQVEQQSRLVQDPVVTEYVNRVGQNLVRNSDAQVPFTIKVVDSDDVNAFALPGGFFFVNSGLILKSRYACSSSTSPDGSSPLTKACSSSSSPTKRSRSVKL